MTEQKFCAAAASLSSFSPLTPLSIFSCCFVGTTLQAASNLCKLDASACRYVVSFFIVASMLSIILRSLFLLVDVGVIPFDSDKRNRSEISCSGKLSSGMLPLTSVAARFLEVAALVPLVPFFPFFPFFPLTLLFFAGSITKSDDSRPPSSSPSCESPHPSVDNRFNLSLSATIAKRAASVFGVSVRQ